MGQSLTIFSMARIHKIGQPLAGQVYKRIEKIAKTANIWPISVLMFHLNSFSCLKSAFLPHEKKYCISKMPFATIIKTVKM